MLQFDLQFYEEFTVAWVRTVKFISGAFFWPTGQLVVLSFVSPEHFSIPRNLVMGNPSHCLFQNVFVVVFGHFQCPNTWFIPFFVSPEHFRIPRNLVMGDPSYCSFQNVFVVPFGLFQS